MLTNRRHNEETRRRMSETQRQQWADPAYRARKLAGIRASKSPRGGLRPRTDEERAKQAETVRRQWADPEKRARLLAARARPSARRLAREAAQRFFGDIEGHREGCTCMIHVKTSKRVSALSGKMVQTFLSEFPTVEVEVQFGRYRVDAYLPPPYHLAFEADGDYWHSLNEAARPDYYAQRDAYLLDRFGLPVVRLTEGEILEAVCAR